MGRTFLSAAFDLKVHVFKTYSRFRQLQRACQKPKSISKEADKSIRSTRPTLDVFRFAVVLDGAVVLIDLVHVLIGIGSGGFPGWS